MLSAARTGTVLFSTTILSLVENWAIVLAEFSTYVKSTARPYNKYLKKINIYVSTSLLFNNYIKNTIY